ncbi:MAG TPA: hypothetical protein VK590_13090, partial [Saprospiraceae bacterium]|nr:hypothetical protein [Saprospiraceae bacterium]
AKYKIIYTLQNLIVYLTYRSNGSPKKLVRLIEEMIKPEPISIIEKKENIGEKRFLEDDKNIYIYQSDNNEKRYFIRINYPNQYRFGYINYLFRPYSASYGNYYKEFSDKILVSTPFLFDHIIKFHPFAFSLQNLELIPEVLSETRSPELRNFIEDLITFLSQSHIRETEIGLFEYKFFHKTTNEIVFLSKSFEDESAAFNFTLDETFHVKLHLSNKIKELRSIYKEFVPDNSMAYIKSIAFLSDQLGDAQFFDSGYDEAIAAYSDAIEVLGEKLINSSKEKSDFENFIVFMKLQLKIGLTYEKMKAYENALAVYVEAFKIAEFYIRKNKFIRGLSSKNDLLQIIVQPFLAELFLIEKLSNEGITLNKIANSKINFMKLFKKISNGPDHNYLVESNFYSNTGTLLFYKNASEAFENNTEEGASIFEFKKLTGYDEILKNKKQFRDYKTSPSSYAHFKKSLSSLLNYSYEGNKNSIENKDIISILQETENILAGFIKNDLMNKKSKKNAKIESKFDKSYLKNIAISLYKLADSLIGTIIDTEKGLDIDHPYVKIRSNLFTETGLGKAKFWSFHKFSINDWNEKYDLNKDKLLFGNNFSKNKDRTINNLNILLFQLIMCMYFWAGQILMHIGKNLESSFMFRRIILSFRMMVSPKSCQDYYPLMEKYFLKQTLRIASWNSNASDRYQIYKFGYSLNLEDNISLENSKSIYLAASSSTEVKEAIILLSELKLKIVKNENFECNPIIGKEKTNIEKVIQEISGLISPYNTISTQFIRYHEFRLQFNLNDLELFRDNKILYDLFKDWRYGEGIFNNFNPPLSDVEYERKKMCIKKDITNFILENKITKDSLQNVFAIIANSIFCLYQIIKIYNGYGVNFVMSYSSLANYHKNMGKYLKYYKLCKLFVDIKVTENYDITQLVEDLIGAEIIRTRDSESEYQMALQYYSKAKQMHNQGSPYKDQILNMYYLEDDFNDTLYHFSIAFERQRINSGKMRTNIEKLQNVVDKSLLYDYKSYVN